MNIMCSGSKCMVHNHVTMTTLCDHDYDVLMMRVVMILILRLLHSPTANFLLVYVLPWHCEALKYRCVVVECRR